MKVDYSIIGGENEILINVTPYTEKTTVSVSRKITKEMVKDVSKIMPNPETATRNFAYTIMREIMGLITERIEEVIEYIDDTSTKHELIMFCKKMERDEVDLMPEDELQEFLSKIYEFLFKHWELSEAEFNDKEFKAEFDKHKTKLLWNTTLKTN